MTQTEIQSQVFFKQKQVMIYLYLPVESNKKKMKRLPKFQPPFKKPRNKTVSLKGAITEEKLACEILAK